MLVLVSSSVFGCSYRFVVVDEDVVSFFVLKFLSHPTYVCAFLVGRVVYRVFSLYLFH